MAIPFLIIIGVAAGFIASKVMKTNLSLVETIAIGILGAIIGGLVLRGLIVAGSMIFGLVGAVAGACVLIWLYQRYVKGRF
ncbi:MAG: GlsB/YeaQ/YmgE family stress response membrane protein [Paracoccaceae bacterium]|jgi:uncharacterized membrane protein YeaQ/YmgE (transglycosylase-associated protein family)|nr:GlsB/YeaQ/YmgE family stress response membrane protein [Paracoccaceae bacterium]